MKPLKRQLPVYSLFAAGAVMAGFTAVLGGLTWALNTTDAHAGAVSTVTVTPSPSSTSFGIDVSTGSIENVFSSIYSNPAYDNLEEFTALEDMIPPQLAEDILEDNANTCACGSLSENQQFIGQLTAIMNSSNNPTVGEFLTQTTPNEVAYTMPSTDQVGYTNMTEAGQTFYVPTYTDPPGCCCDPTIITNSTTITSVLNLGEIAQATIGDRVDAVSSTTTSLGNDVYSLKGVVDTSSTTTVGTVTLTTVTAQEWVGSVVVNLYQLSGYRFVSPIVLDLPGNGRLEASKGMWLPHPGQLDKSNLHLFDFYNNGFPLVMEWVGPKDGLLVEPKADGSVDAGCLFGTQGGWMNGFQKLSVRDKKGDGRLTGDELKGLMVWVDSNQDAKCQPDELKSLADLGITEIDINQKHMRSMFVMNGKSHYMWDWFPSGLDVKHISREAAVQQREANQQAMRHERSEAQ